VFFYGSSEGWCVTDLPNDSLHIGAWLVLPLENSLINEDKSKVIEPQCMALLLYFSKKPMAVISRDELLNEVWKNIVVNENTLTKTIAMLRKALEDDSNNPSYIVTHLKKGYQLIAQVISTPSPASNIIHPQLPEENKTRKNKTIIKLKFFATFVCIFLIGFWFFDNVNDATFNKGIEQYNRIVPITSGPEIERDPSFSPNGHYVLYSQYSAKTGFDLRLYSIKQKHHKVLSDFHGSELSATWSDNGQRIAYFHKTNSKCTVNVSLFDPNKKLKQGSVITQCGHNNEGQLSWLDKDTLLFTDRNIETLGEHKLYQVQVSSGIKREISNHYPFSFAVAKKDRKIALLGRQNGAFNAEIKVLSMDKKKVTRTLSGFNLFNEFDWFSDEQRLLVSDDYHGKLSVIDANGTKRDLFQANVMLSQPDIKPTSDEIVAVQAFVQSNIYQVPITSYVQEFHNKQQLNAAKQIVASKYFDYRHEYSPQTGVFGFLSNRTGTHELWINSQEQESIVDLDLLEKNDIVNFRWSPSGENILIELGGGELFVYHVSTQSKRQININHDRLMYPVWGENDTKLIYATPTGFSPKVWKYDIPTATEESLGFKNVISVAASPDGAHLYLLKLDSSLWVYDRTAKTETIIKPYVTWSAWGNLVAFDDGVYWQESSESGYEVHNYKVNTKIHSRILSISQEKPLPIRYFHVSPKQDLISFYQLSQYESDIVLIKKSNNN
jgi:DNA-binding winged helix-turn-helix (wHTH) protein/Tol biopolymer transport system component